jgi:large subunit GTPase 1
MLGSDHEEDEEEEEEAGAGEVGAGAGAAGEGGEGAQLAKTTQQRSVSDVLTRHELLDILEKCAVEAAGEGRAQRRDGRVVVGMVGYPNVGKSSTVNSLVGQSDKTSNIDVQDDHIDIVDDHIDVPYPTLIYHIPYR